MRHVILIFLFLGHFPLAAQLQRIFHQSFEVSDSVTVLELSLHGDFQVETWAGNGILLESNIKLFNASEGVLNHFLETGRYALEARQEGGHLFLVAKDKERRPVKTGKGECFEEIQQRLFIPEEFSPVKDGVWQRANSAAPSVRPPDSTQKAPAPKKTGKQGS